MGEWIFWALCGLWAPAAAQDGSAMASNVRYGAPARTYRRAEWEPRLNELRQAFGRNKEIPEEYELAALLALSHYPELADARIRFVINYDQVPITSKPAIGTLFRAKKHRVYIITISDADSRHPAYLKNQSFNAQVGGLGHELAHTVYYERKSFWNFIAIGVSFASGKFQKRFERDTDRRAIEYGLGWQIYDWALELRGGRVRDDPNFWLDRYYLSPELVADHMRKVGGYPASAE